MCIYEFVFFLAIANDDSTKTAHFNVKCVKIVMAHCGTSDRDHEYYIQQKTHRIRIIYDKKKDRTHNDCTSEIQLQQQKRHTHTHNNNNGPLYRMIKCASHDNITLQKKITSNIILYIFLLSLSIVHTISVCIAPSFSFSAFC